MQPPFFFVYFTVNKFLSILIYQGMGPQEQGCYSACVMQSGMVCIYIKLKIDGSPKALILHFSFKRNIVKYITSIHISYAIKEEAIQRPWPKRFCTHKFNRITSSKITNRD